MKKIIIGLFLLGCGVLIGCEQKNFEITKDETGAIYRLNKKTGELTLIKNDLLVPVKDQEEMLFEEKQHNDRLSQALAWGPYNISGKELFVKTITSWRDGKIYLKAQIFPNESMVPYFEKLESLRNRIASLADTYNRSDIFTMTNVSSNLKAAQAEYVDLASSSVSVIGLDKNGMHIKSFAVPLSKMTGVTNEQGEIEYREYQINETLGKSEYEAIEIFSIGWSLDDRYFISKKEDKKE